MSKPVTNSEGLLLPGLDGANPLAFLAALGTLRLLDGKQPLSRLSWRPHASGWTAVVHSPGLNTGDHLCRTILSILNEDQAEHPARRWEAFRRDDPTALRTLINDNRDAWSVCIGIEPLPNTDLTKRFSQLQIARQDYHVKAINNLLDYRYELHGIQRSLLQVWDYNDPLEGVTLHLDPSEDRRHAYQWNQPAGDPARKISGNMIVANRLALEALPLFPCIHNREAAQTVGFQGNRVHDTFWTWPIWSVSVGVDAVRSILTLSELQEASVNSNNVRARGIAAVNRAQRILVGNTPNLTPPRQVA